jgi:hypothetical protein
MIPAAPCGSWWAPESAWYRDVSVGRGRTRSSPASDGTEAVHTMVPLRPALFIFVNALLCIKDAWTICTMEVLAAMARCDCFSVKVVGLGAHPQLMSKTSVLPQWFCCGGPRHFSGMLSCVFKLTWATVQVKNSRRWRAVTVSRCEASALRRAAPRTCPTFLSHEDSRCWSI